MKYFALMCTEEVRPLGECEDFEHASERADALDPPWGCHWVFSEDRNHKLSLRLVQENTLIAFSKDNHRGVAKRFGKSVASAGHAQLRAMLAYKSLTGGTQYIEVASRNSTKTCSSCGCLSGPTGLAGLAVRDWRCPACGAEHDRDTNAAINTLILGLGQPSNLGLRNVA